MRRLRSSWRHRHRRSPLAAALPRRRFRAPDTDAAATRSRGHPAPGAQGHGHPHAPSRSPGCRSPSACSTATAIQRGQQTVGIDEALNNMPGVVVANRYNFSLDQRISIRGFGSRSNFGVRGLKILLDGIPQTLPDGQSQLTNVDFADLERAEVLRGASSSLYGNASGGVISLRDASAPRRRRSRSGCGSRAATASATATAFYKWQSWTSGRSGSASGTLSISPVQGRRLPAAQRGGDPAAQRRRWTTPLSGTTARHAAAQPRPTIPRPRTPAPSPGPSTRPTPTRPRPTTSSAAPTRTSSSSSSRSGCKHFDDRRERVRGDACSACCATWRTRWPRRHRTSSGPDRRHLRHHRPRGRRGSGQRQPAPRRRRRRRRGSGAGADVQRMRDDRQNFVSDAGVPDRRACSSTSGRR